MFTGVSTASLFTRLNNEDALPLLRRMGVESVEVFLTSFSEYGYPFAEQLRSAAEGLRVHSVHALTSGFEPQLFSKHARVRSDAYAWLERVLDSAHALRAPFYTFHGTTRMKRATRSGEKDDFTAMSADFSELCAFCVDRGVRLCLENVEWSTYNRPSVFSRLAEAVPSLLGVLDIKQARISEYPYEAYLSEMGERLAYVHISDVTPDGRMCLPGKGVFDFETLVARLQDVGFDGELFVEAYSGDYGDFSELKIAVDYVNELLYKRGALRLISL